MPAANQQLLRQKPLAQSLARQGLHLRQSLQLVQIMLHASLGTLFYLREFLPLSCFGDRDLLFIRGSSPSAPEPDEPLNPLTESVSYQAFLRSNDHHCSSGPSKRPISHKGQPLKVILRGKHEKADKILDLLENGIFTALSQNLLDAVQITVFADKTNPANVLETYTFTFTYANSTHDDINHGLATINLNANGSTTEINASRISARNSIEMIIRRLITLSTFLPRLPKDRFMEIHLFHRDNCPSDYSPPGFQLAPDSQLEDSFYYPEDEEWATETQTCGAANTGLHSVGLKVTSLKYRGTSTAALDHEDGPIQVPHNLRHTKRVRREDEIGLDDQPSLSPSLTQQLDAAAEKKLQDTVSPTTGFSQMSTQTRQDQLAKHMLQKMIIPSTPASDIVPTQVRANDLQTLIADDEQDTQLMRPEISQADLVRLARTQSGTYYPNPSMRQMNNGNGSHGSSNIIGLDINNCDDNAESDVLCQCGWKGKPANERMLRCSFCDKLQHPVCYGFLHGEDPSIPAVHACYQCLLDPVTEGRALRELGTLAMLRQALKVIVEKGYPGRVREFSALLHCNGHTVIQITDILRKQGFLVATPGSRSRGFASTGLPKYRIPFCVKMRERLRREIFNPLLKIEHHYIIPDGSQAQAQTTLATRSQQRHESHQTQLVDPRPISAATSNDRSLFANSKLSERSPKKLDSQASAGVETPGSATRDASHGVKRRRLSCLRSPISIGGVMSDEMDDDEMSGF